MVANLSKNRQYCCKYQNNIMVNPQSYKVVELIFAACNHHQVSHVSVIMLLISY